ncbi:MAG TPA: SDR family NAD(P)-dependent oxidoreductase [Solirubrobacteraceae bacterium]|nr:SDR family NAD(P)-dependent oxidoreductase [Solirubrobacteraceae bacterium]
MLDTALDRTVIAGYTRLGYAVRSRRWDDAELSSLRGRVAAVTGASSGLGLAAAEGLAALGADVWLVVRDRARGERARELVARRSGSADVHLALCDLADLRSVRTFAERFAAWAERLDVLVNNAGVMCENRTLSPDGIELTLAVNVVGPFLLTSLLAPSLARSAPSRIINVSSGGMYTKRLRVDDLQSRREPFSGAAAYAHAKRAQVVLTELWAERLRDAQVAVHAMHPGWADTPGVRDSLPRFHRLLGPLLRTPRQGADTIVWLAAAERPGRSSGLFWHDRRPRPTHLVPWTRESESEREALWQLCVSLSGADELVPSARC